MRVIDPCWEAERQVPHKNAFPLKTSGSDRALRRVRAAIAEMPELDGFLGPVRSAVRLAGLSNPVFRLETASGQYALRLPRAETASLVDRAAEAHNLQLAATLGVAVVPVFHHPATGMLLTPWAGTSGTPCPEALGLLLARLHAAPFRFRGTIEPDDLIAAQEAMLSGASAHYELFLPLSERLAAVGAADPVATAMVPSHGDPGPGNCLVAPEGLRLIDWEFAAMAPSAWDLAYAVLENGWDTPEEQAFLSAYSDDGRDLDGLCRQVGIMKPRCDAISALWALGQAALENDATDFLKFAEQRVARGLASLERLSGAG
jgi:aminoglycoside phosphotransferase (APT) family kinase protein